MILTRSGIAEEEHPSSIAAYMANNVVDKKGVMAGKLKSAYGAAWGARFHETLQAILQSPDRDQTAVANLPQ